MAGNFAAPSWPANPPADGLYLYRSDARSLPRVARFRDGRWIEPFGKIRGIVLDRPQFWIEIPADENWHGAYAVRSAA